MDTNLTDKLRAFLTSDCTVDNDEDLFKTYAALKEELPRKRAALYACLAADSASPNEIGEIAAASSMDYEALKDLVARDMETRDVQAAIKQGDAQ